LPSVADGNAQPAVLRLQEVIVFAGDAVPVDIDICGREYGIPERFGPPV
jgi:hypothetical protein